MNTNTNTVRDIIIAMIEEDEYFCEVCNYIASKDAVDKISMLDVYKYLCDDNALLENVIK